ncbi:glycosyltransferase family 4 protein [Sulfurihydrogenibium sp.]|jgi:hypothetical protein|uniref:glycosyltransferase n=1 Tax=Sulfurihydrogenibium sp. TaxID=2053621 RepID=UPI002636F3E8|nr:glycosyltransferase family 4 protein [Sulfurihydrogenibium sp.]
MKKILIVSPIPVSYPPKDGYSMVVFYRSYFLKNFAKIESDIIVPENEKYPAKNLDDSGVFNNVFSYPMNGKWKSLIKSFFSKETYTMIRHDLNNENLQNIIKKISKNKYTATIFDYSGSYPLYKKLIQHINVENDKIIYWSHNIDFIDFKNVTIETNNLARKIFYYIIYKKLEKIESDYIRKFTKIVSVAKHEINILKKINPMASVYWIPPMLPEPKPIESNKEYLSKIDKKIINYKYKILFAGDLKRSSNFISAIWFANKVFPIIRKELNACFMIVGKDPSKEIVKLVENNKDIFLFPNVPSMVPFYEISDLVVVPLFNPAGIKLKLIEALKYKKKVVARPEALLGAGLEYIVPNATEPEDFAKKCIDVLEDKINYEIIWKKFDEMYDNENIIKEFLRIVSNYG